MSDPLYWQTCYTGSDSARNAARSWFYPLAEDLTVTKAEIQCVRETDAETGKMRLYGVETDGRAIILERRRTKAGWTLSIRLAD